MKKKSTKPESGGARLIRNGRRAVLLGLSPEDAELFDRARGMIPMTKFLVHHAREAAQKIIPK